MLLLRLIECYWHKISDNILKESESVVGFQPQHGHPTFTPKPLQKYRFKVAFWTVLPRLFSSWKSTQPTASAITTLVHRETWKGGGVGLGGGSGGSGGCMMYFIHGCLWQLFIFDKLSLHHYFLFLPTGNFNNWEDFMVDALTVVFFFFWITNFLSSVKLRWNPPRLDWSSITQPSIKVLKT